MHIPALRDQNGIALVSVASLPQILDALKLNATDVKTEALAQTISKELVRILSPHATGVVLSPEHTFYAILHKSETAGLVLTIEKQIAEIDPASLPTLLNRWSVENIRQNYGVAKLRLAYHPSEPQALTKKKFVAEIYEHCKHLGIDLLLELLVYHNATQLPDKATLLQDQLTAIQELRDKCDGMILEYLNDPLAAATITTELDVPWIISSADPDYERAKSEIRAGIEAGATGFIISTALFPPTEFITKALNPNGNLLAESVPEWFTFLNTVSKDRIIELRRILAENRISN
ncbi:MAG: hypothetical protein WAU07_04220 [Microgenomates group bacterium]